jgi:hypothetical protein
MPPGYDPLSPRPQIDASIQSEASKSNKKQTACSSKDINPRNDLNFMELTGSNTFYVTHPEEIIAGVLPCLFSSEAHR